MPRSVDLPAPFGPSRPRMSPDLSDRDTRDTALRRPKCRERSVMSMRSKSKVTEVRPSTIVRPRRTGATRSRSGGDARARRRLRTRPVFVERAVDILERGQQFFTTRRVARLVDPAPPLILLQPHEILEQLLAAGDRAACVRRSDRPRIRSTALRPRRRAATMTRGQRQRDVARRRCCDAAAP